MVLLKSAAVPVAVFPSPVLAKSVAAPKAVLKLPLLTVLRENQPVPVLNPPVVRLVRTPKPSAVLPPGRTPSRSVACTLCGSAKQTNRSGMRKQCRTGGRLIGFFTETLSINQEFVFIQITKGTGNQSSGIVWKFQTDAALRVNEWSARLVFVDCQLTRHQSEARGARPSILCGTRSRVQF